MASDIPPPLITAILSNLPVKSLLRFRSVSRKWRSMIDGPHFINLHLDTSKKTVTNQTLIVRNSRVIYSVGFSELDRAIQIEDHPLKTPFRGTEVLGSCNGLICLSNGDEYIGEGEGDSIIYNPATKRHHWLGPFPRVEFPDEFPISDSWLYGFGYDKIHDDYKLVRIIQFIDEHDVNIYSLKSRSWNKAKSFEYNLWYSRTCGEYLNGCLHWVGVTRESGYEGLMLILAYDLGSDQWEVVPQPDTDSGSTSLGFPMNVGVLHECLYVMYSYARVEIEIDLWVMKEYGVKESWTKVFSVAQDRIMDGVKHLKPLVYSKDGSKLLLGLDFQVLVWFDVRTHRAERVNIRGMPGTLEGDLPVEIRDIFSVRPGIFQMELLVESLVPLHNKEYKKKETKRTPKKRRNADDMDNCLIDGWEIVHGDIGF